MKSYVPLSSNPSTRVSSTPYSVNGADIPSWDTAIGNSALSKEQLQQRLASEWLNAHKLSSGDFSNPPFNTTSAGRLHPVLNGEKIVRGYIRRASYDGTDPVSSARLNFMYNPETIIRDYVSYLDQAALDPFNTVYQSSNLVAPPSFMNFNFELFFDRGDEVAMDGDHPGVFVDYEFFDLVVRNVIPSAGNQTSNQIPDNGVMMVNPRDITVVFSDQITVQGRPINAQVRFEKFSHKMVPTRMRISLEMRVVYIGPQKSFYEYQAIGLQGSTTDTLLTDDSKSLDFKFVDYVSLNSGTNPNQGLGGPLFSDEQQQYYEGVVTSVENTNQAARLAAFDWIQSHIKKGYTEYSFDKYWYGLNTTTNLIQYTACSPLVITGYHFTCGTQNLKGWDYKHGNSRTMVNGFGFSTYHEGQAGHNGDLIFAWNADPLSPSGIYKKGVATEAQAKAWFSSQSNRNLVQKGDLIISLASWHPGAKFGHVAIFNQWEGTRGNYSVLEACPVSVGINKRDKAFLIKGGNLIVRPRPLGQDIVSATTGTVSNPLYTGRNFA